MSTIEEMKEEKARIGRLITDVLKAFEDKHGVEVSRVELSRAYNIGEAEPRIRSVTIEVKV